MYDGVCDLGERQMGTRQSDYDLHIHAYTLTIQSIYNACDIYEQPKHPEKLDLSTVCVWKKEIQVCRQSRGEE